MSGPPWPHWILGGVSSPTGISSILCILQDLPEVVWGGCGLCRKMLSPSCSVVAGRALGSDLRHRFLHYFPGNSPFPPRRPPRPLTIGRGPAALRLCPLVAPDCPSGLHPARPVTLVHQRQDSRLLALALSASIVSALTLPSIPPSVFDFIL